MPLPHENISFSLYSIPSFLTTSQNTPIRVVQTSQDFPERYAPSLAAGGSVVVRVMYNTLGQSFAKRRGFQDFDTLLLVPHLKREQMLV